MGDLFAGLCLWPRHHRRIRDIPEALCARHRDHQRVLAKVVPARLHRSGDENPAGQAAGAVFLPLGRRPHVLHRPSQHLRAVQPDGGVRGQHGRLHGADGGEEPAEGHSLRQPLHQDLSGNTGERRVGRCLQGEIQRVSHQLVVGECDRHYAAGGSLEEGEFRRRQEDCRGVARPDHQMPVRRRRHRDDAGRGPDPDRLCDRLGRSPPNVSRAPRMLARCNG